MIAKGSLPAWNGMGILPPIKPGMQGNSPERSPYFVDLMSFVDRFSFSPERIRILDGLLQFREELYKLGIVSGFQWLDGSFLENIELLGNRSPNDMDVVTFYDLPSGETQKSLFQKAHNLFNCVYLKTIYAIDGYFITLGQSVDIKQVRNISYWYSMWSHRRNGLWKGFVQVNLDPLEDIKARTLLNLNKEEMSNE
jgi:hypothetical protein